MMPLIVVWIMTYFLKSERFVAHKTVYFIEPLFHRSYCAHRIQRSCHQSDDDAISPPDLILMETYVFRVFFAS